ncbi:MAG: fasciclin domain-containing protein, partial [Terriglobales bacterium]
MADPKGALTKVLTYHVIGERLSPKQLAGTHKTRNGANLTITGSDQGDSHFSVGANNATVGCDNIQTANATVYIVDSVLMPPSIGSAMPEASSTKPSAPSKS